MPIMYYGSKISDNMVETPEGYLICKNVPIGRTGNMEYLGEELGIENMRGKTIQVFRKAENLFSAQTIASFEGKPVTNNHPTQLLDVDTVSMLAKGHAENVRQDGDYLVADLYVIDKGLIAEIQNGKREVSCGYDAEWVEQEDGSYEQINIVGNHVAVVRAGRAGATVAIKDSKPQKTGGKEMKKGTMLARMFKAFAVDAEPEEIAKAMDEMLGGEQETPGEQKQENDAMAKLMEAVNGISQQVSNLTDRIAALEKSDKEVHQEIGADEEMNNLENEMKDADPESGKEAKTVEPSTDESEKKEANDANPLMKFVQDMKPIIMSIDDEKTRNAMAKKFADSMRAARNGSGYVDIINMVTNNRQQAMDTAGNNAMSMDQAAEMQAQKWAEAGKAQRGGK